MNLQISYNASEQRYEWRNDAGHLHREDGPALVYDDGSREWYENDQLHREDGPAFEHISGYKVYYVNGKRHRLDGPAVENANGYKFWYIDGQTLSEKEFNKRTKDTNKTIVLDGVTYKLIKM